MLNTNFLMQHVLQSASCHLLDTVSVQHSFFFWSIVYEFEGKLHANQSHRLVLSIAGNRHLKSMYASVTLCRPSAEYLFGQTMVLCVSAPLLRKKYKLCLKEQNVWMNSWKNKIFGLTFLHEMYLFYAQPKFDQLLDYHCSLIALKFS